MKTIQELQTEYHELNAEIESYQRAILQHVDEKSPVETLLIGYRNLIEECAEIRFKLRELNK